jgi:hypothetical protein
MPTTDLTTRNQETLARLQALCAAEEARFAHLPSPEHGAMDALKEAIDERAAEMGRLASAGRAESNEYAQAESQHQRWDFAWRRNR